MRGRTVLRQIFPYLFFVVKDLLPVVFVVAVGEKEVEHLFGALEDGSFAFALLSSYNFAIVARAHSWVHIANMSA